MAYNNRQIFTHLLAAEKLDKIIDHAFEKLDLGVSENYLHLFIKKELKRNNLVSDNIKTIVAFNENSALPHYSQDNNKKISEGTLVLVDVWARLNEKDSVYADLTKIAFYGEKTPNKIKHVFETVLLARDASIYFIEKKLKKNNFPSAEEVDNIARRLISEKGFGEKFIHSTGHSLGTGHVHGGTKIGKKVNKKLENNMLYTIEPGIYFNGEFGMRSEVDILIKDYVVVRSAALQREILHIKP